MRKSIFIFIALAVITAFVLSAGCTSPSQSPTAVPTTAPTVSPITADPIVGTWNAQRTNGGIVEDYKIEFNRGGFGTLYVTSYGVIVDHPITWKSLGEQNYELDMDIATAGLYQKNMFTLNNDMKSFELIEMLFTKS